MADKRFEFTSEEYHVDLPGVNRLKATFRGPYIVSHAEYERLQASGCDMKHFRISTRLPEETEDKRHGDEQPQGEDQKEPSP